MEGMEKRDSRTLQPHFSHRLQPLQTLKSDAKFCSLAELKTCLDSAQINSFQKESKNSILKLLEGGNRTVDERKCLYTLWKYNQRDRTERWNYHEINAKVSTKLAKGSVYPHTVPTKGRPSTTQKTQPKKATSPNPHLSDSAENPAHLEEEGRGDSPTLSELQYKPSDDENDEFEELSDIDGEDSVINSRSDSTVSWNSLDASCKQDEVSDSVATTDSGLGSDADISNLGTHPPVTHSHFKHCPPVLYFPADNEKLSRLPRALHKQLKWKMSTITPNVVKNVIARAGFVPSTKRREWIGYWGKHMKASAFRNIQSHQKVNHFPGTFEIGRKDKLWKNLYKAQVKYTKKEYDFIPLTFCLPSEWKSFKRYWDETGHKYKWIIKPPASARGIGIKVIHKVNQIPRKRSIIIQRYLANPYLINGKKFDLRMYVYVTSYDPLTIYLYDNGLVRFATSKYSHSTKSLSNRYAHLTNYSVNKNNNAYIKNEDESGTDSHKWGIKALWKYLELARHDIVEVQNKIKNIIIKTMISSVPTVTSLSKSHCKYKHTCHELFGFDIFLDHHLKPWLLEVNISPSLHTNSALDKSIKYGLVKDMLNTAGYLVPEYPIRSKSSGCSTRTPVLRYTSPGTQQQEDSETVSDTLLYFNTGLVVSADEKAKHTYFTQRLWDIGTMENMLDKLTPDDIRVLMGFEDERSRRGDMELIFPTEHTARYNRFFVSPKYYDLLLLQWVKKYVRDPSKGVARLQRLSESEVQFIRQPTVEHIWSKQNHRHVKRTDKLSDAEKKRALLSREAESEILKSKNSLAFDVDYLVKKELSPICYKPPLPLPRRHHHTVPPTRSITRSQTSRILISKPESTNRGTDGRTM